MKNYTKVKVYLRNNIVLEISDEELTAIKLSEEYMYIEYLNDAGMHHRVGGPAREWHMGSEEWFIDGKIHRERGPAITWSTGSKWWAREGRWHRVDGPAVEKEDGTKEWWVHGKQHTQEEFNRWVRWVHNTARHNEREIGER